MGSYVYAEAGNEPEAQAKARIASEAYNAWFPTQYTDTPEEQELFDAYSALQAAFDAEYCYFKWNGVHQTLTGLVADVQYTAQDAQDGLANALRAYEAGQDTLLSNGRDEDVPAKACNVDGRMIYVTMRQMEQLKALADLECGFYIA